MTTDNPKPSNEAQAGQSLAASGLFGVMEAVCPGLNEAFTTLVRDLAASIQTKPECPHGNAFCDDDWLPTHPPCGCKPTTAQIYVMTHYAISPNAPHE